MRPRVLSLQIIFLICSDAAAQIDSGGGKTPLGGWVNHSSFGEAIQSGDYLVGDFHSRSGLIEKLYARQAGTLATPAFILENSTETPGYSMDSTPGISGSTVPDGTVEFYLDGVGIGTTQSDSFGKWSFTAEQPWRDGTHSLVTKVKDFDGNSSPRSDALTVTVDTTAPASPAVDALVTNQLKPVITGQAVFGAGEILSVAVNGATYSSGWRLRSGRSEKLSGVSGKHFR